MNTYKHGQLARVCELCELQAQLAAKDAVIAKHRLGFSQIEHSMSQAKIDGSDKYREIFLSHSIAEQALTIHNDDMALQAALHKEWLRGLKDAVGYLDDQGEDFLRHMAEGGQ